MAFKRVKVRLKQNVSKKDFWRATYNTDSNLGIRLVQNFDNMKNNYLDAKLSQRGSLEVTIPISYYNRERETIDDDYIDYGYIKEMKDIWEIVE